ncbi:membrane-bound lytic murein transglycosylase MltF [Marinobacter sp. SS21]|uniref:membrane-bound lytic murein transglycosylase MltF n=1 Tax=Marinobacter sp. SS21 TaxID=2979460 RepID=UPI00232CBEA1|nr:membrane-bound lytic murein transglycosylase MltF [Marinobacter sp. SS21]MDC0664259.1 membrane-bound lytic murein transglycosylase MltF [Marinobacter sp. SS21]
MDLARLTLTTTYRDIRIGAYWLAIAGYVLLATGCSRPSTLEEIRSEGVLHVITRNAPSIYYEDQHGPAGFEYELAQRFADHLGVALRVRVAEDNTEILSVLDRNYAHIGLAGLAEGPEFAERFHTVPIGMQAQSVVIYNREINRPQSVADIADTPVHIIADSYHVRHLQALQSEHPALEWQQHSELDAAGLLKRVESGELPVAVIASNELAINHVFFPGVKEAFSLSEPENLAWLLPIEQDPSLVNAAKDFLAQLDAEGTLAQLTERYYGHLDRLNYVGARTFVHHVRNRLPRYENLFRDFGSKHGLDWRLLAAIGYQESHWRPNAVSPTGVKGLMMLTRNTASYVGISNRLDPKQSIEGGARYFTMVHDRIPERIPEPDRTWFALASYNVGFGHLEDARRLTEAGGKNPDRWMDVKEFLPLLAQKEWYTKTRFGYARGHEPVIYVQNIRRYYDVLAWMRDPSQATEQVATQEVFDLSGEVRTETGSSGQDRATLPKALGVTPPTL